MGDAECTAGSVWEAANFCSFNNLNNILTVVDFNKIGATENISSFSDPKLLEKKWVSFGWNVINVEDGNDLNSLIKAYKKFVNNKNKPTVILANTIKGKGIKMLENDPIWHTKQIDNTNYEKALKDLKNSFK